MKIFKSLRFEYQITVQAFRKKEKKICFYAV